MTKAINWGCQQPSMCAGRTFHNPAMFDAGRHQGGRWARGACRHASKKVWLGLTDPRLNLHPAGQRREDDEALQVVAQRLCGITSPVQLHTCKSQYGDPGQGCDLRASSSGE